MYKVKETSEGYEIYINGNLHKTYQDKRSVLNDLVVVANHLTKTEVREKEFVLHNIALVKDSYKLFKKESAKMLINDEEFDIKFSTFIRFKKFVFCKYKVFIPYDRVIDFEIHNRLLLSGFLDNGYGFRKTLSYNIFNYKKGKNRISKLKILKDKDTTLYIRQSAGNKVYVTNRQIKETDNKEIQKLINKAWFRSKFFFKNIVLMYEKESSRYQESASIVYERLIDMGYNNVYYVLDKENIENLKIDDKYKKNIIEKNTFKHFLYFFGAKTLIGTESPAHAIDLRIANRKAMNRIYSNKFRYVFLQHGVMYMVSLDSGGRSFFRKGGTMPKKGKVVVSSMEEAKHFIDLGGYDLEDLYVCGLPKFDRAYRNKKHERIIIMPTWRPWEFNIVRDKPEDTTYYKFIKNILDNIPSNLKKYVTILPHPLFQEAMQNSDLKKYMIENAIYDEILRETDILITDYSSIAYDAFYRGSNVIFCWTDKDECMEHYDGHLMLNDDNVYGDVCYNYKDIKKSVEKHYSKKQPKEYVKKYSKIVEFHDNKNTDRLIEMLKNDKIIK